jgi:hypothetical protein
MEIKTQRYILPDAESGVAQPGHGPPKKMKITLEFLNLYKIMA